LAGEFGDGGGVTGIGHARGMGVKGEERVEADMSLCRFDVPSLATIASSLSG
jgi:hypothetical protein